MDMMIPMKVLDVNCRACPNFTAEISSRQILDDERKTVGYIVEARCANLDICREGIYAKPQQ